MFRVLLIPLFVCILCVLFELPVRAGITDVRVGFEGPAHNGIYKNGLWTPITVESAQPVETLIIQSSDSDGTPITYHYKDLSSPTAKRQTVLAKLGRKNEPINISVNGNAFQSFAVPPPVPAERPIYLIFGNEDIGLQGAVAELMLREDRRPLLVKVHSLADLPTEWFGYESVEMVVLTTTEPEFFIDSAGHVLQADSRPIQALHTWLKLGGTMLLCAGRNTQQLLENDESFLHLFLPAPFDSMAELRNGLPFERFAGSQRQIFMNGTEEAPFLRMPRLAEFPPTDSEAAGHNTAEHNTAVPDTGRNDNPFGIVLIKDGDLPLLLRRAYGLGTMIYFGGDLSGRPMSSWRDRTTLVRNIMQWNQNLRPGSGTTPVRSGTMLQLGYSDITGQIRSALDHFEGVRIVPFSVILIILATYWLIVGLFDWYFVHKVLQRPAWTWLTFPLWIVLFSILTYVLAAPGRPHKEQHNLLTFYDFDSETNTSRLGGWLTIYSPADTYFSQPYGFEQTYFSWNGLPGSGLGGMAPNTVSPSIWQVGSKQYCYSALLGVPIQARSTKSFFTLGKLPNSPINRIFSQLSDEEGIPTGMIEIPDGFFPDPDFHFALKDTMLVYGRWALELGDVSPGQTITVSKTSPRRELRDLLIPPQTLADENRYGDHLRRLATYNVQSKDLDYIARVMSLHRALGGFEATGLHHAYKPSLDMSDLLTTDRALLIGMMPTLPAFVLDKHQHEVISQRTIVRISLPIKLTPSSLRLGRDRPLSGDGSVDVLDGQARPGHIENPWENRNRWER